MKPLHHAAWDGDIKVLQGIINQPLMDLNIKDEKGYTALHVAVKAGNVDAIRALKAAGADLTIQDKKGRTPLQWAQAKNADPSITKALQDPIADS